MEKQVLYRLTAGSDQILCFVKMKYTEESHPLHSLLCLNVYKFSFCELVFVLVSNREMNHTGGEDGDAGKAQERDEK